MNVIGTFFKNAVMTLVTAASINSHAQMNLLPDLVSENGSFKKHHALADTPKSTVEDRPEERDIIAKMATAGYANFILLNKKKSKLYLIQDSDFILQTPVIFGRGEGHKNLTPSGVFSLTNVFQGETKPAMSFHADHRVIYLIHGVVPGRERALNSDNMRGRQLSDGCINVPDTVLPYVLGFARQMARLNHQQQSTPFIVMDEVYMAPRFIKLLQQFVPEHYNPN